MTNPIGALFGRSPIRPIETHMDKAQGSVKLLGSFLKASIAAEWDEAAAIHEQIVQAEQDADEMKRDIRKHLPKSLFLPFSRSDLLELLRLQDRLPNHCRDISHLLLTRQTRIPEALSQPLIEYFISTQEASAQAHAVIHELDELLETGFRGKETELVAKMVEQIDTTESTCVEKETALRKTLHELEEQISPVDVLYLDKMIEGLGRILGASHRIGNQLLLLMSS